MWYDDFLIILRALINDLSATPTYSDNRLIELILIAAHLVNMEVSFDNDFVVYFDTSLILPDPSDRNGGTRDDNFINLVCLKAACLLSQGESKDRGGQSISIKDGKSSISTTDRAKISMEISKSFCEAYNNAKFAYQTNRSAGVKAVVSPFRWQEGGNWGVGY